MDKSTEQYSPQTHALILSEALPFMQRYDQAIVVVKYGGHAMGDEQLADLLRPGHRAPEQSGDQADRGPWRRPADRQDARQACDQERIRRWPARHRRRDRRGRRDGAGGSINKQIVAAINKAGGRACGMSGKDANLMIAKKLERKVRDPGSNIERMIDLGFVGEPEKVDPRIVRGDRGRRPDPGGGADRRVARGRDL